MSTSRLQLAQQKHPTLFAGVVDCFSQHDDWCNKLSGGDCNCTPDVTLTTKSGKYAIALDGICTKLGAAGECLPCFYDPRDGSLN